MIDQGRLALPDKNQRKLQAAGKDPAKKGEACVRALLEVPGGKIYNESSFPPSARVQGENRKKRSFWDKHRRMSSVAESLSRGPGKEKSV